MEYHTMSKAVWTATVVLLTVANALHAEQNLETFPSSLPTHDSQGSIEVGINPFTMNVVVSSQGEMGDNSNLGRAVRTSDHVTSGAAGTQSQLEHWTAERPGNCGGIADMAIGNMANTFKTLFRDLELSLREVSPGIWITISEKGLDYLKEVLLTQILQALTPLHLPDIRKTVNLPVVGKVDAVLSKIILVGTEVPNSTVALGQSGVTILGSGVRANLTLYWKYKYHARWLPAPISDGGRADVKVQGMHAGITITGQEQGGALSLIIVQCGTCITDLDVDLHGGRSWLYQWLVDAFDDRLRATIQDQLTAQIEKGVRKLDSLMLELPRHVAVDRTSELDFTIVQAPVISPTSISIGIRGEFISLNSSQVTLKKLIELRPGLTCGGSMKMLTITLNEFVLNSAAAVYYNAGLLNWLVDKMPDQAFLNTAKWKYLVPQLYLQYPNEDMKLEFSVLSPPNITITSDGIQGVAAADMTIEVLDKNDTIAVACISLTVSVHGYAALDGKNITGYVKLNDLDLDVKWSNVGSFHLALVKVFLRTLVKDALFPILNLSLRRGFPLPIISSVDLYNAVVNYGYGYILVCTDVLYIEGF